MIEEIPNFGRIQRTRLPQPGQLKELLFESHHLKEAHLGQTTFPHPRQTQAMSLSPDPSGTLSPRPARRGRENSIPQKEHFCPSSFLGLLNGSAIQRKNSLPLSAPGSR